MIVGTACLVVVVTATIGGAIRATAVTQPRPTTTPDAPGIILASSHQLDLPDPFLLSAHGRYYLYFSTAFNDPNHANVPELSGEPGHWGPVSDAMPKVPAWAVPASAGGSTWDPYVVQLGQRYVMYFATTLRHGAFTHPTHPTHCIGVAVSVSPEGPFVPVGREPLLCQDFLLGGDIDAQLFQDPHGPRGPAHHNYLVWKSDNNNLPGSGPTMIWAAPLSDSGLALAGKDVAIFSADRAWEEPVLEAPQMVEAPDGSDWLFFSGGTGFYSSRYAVGVAKCAGPLGGCHDTSSSPLISSNAQGSGPGEETVFVATDGSVWLLYNPWHAGAPFAVLRPVEAVHIGWNSLGPYVAEAGTFPSAS